MILAVFDYTEGELIIENVPDNDFDAEEYVNKEYGTDTYWMQVKKLTTDITL